MPLKPGTSKATVQGNFHDFRHGKTFARTERKFGVKKARAQMVAAVMSEKRKTVGEIYRHATGKK